jgi:hypothetical protein
VSLLRDCILSAIDSLRILTFFNLTKSREILT